MYSRQLWALGSYCMTPVSVSPSTQWEHHPNKPKISFRFCESIQQLSLREYQEAKKYGVDTPSHL